MTDPLPTMMDPVPTPTTCSCDREGEACLSARERPLVPRLLPIAAPLLWFVAGGGLLLLGLWLPIDAVAQPAPTAAATDTLHLRTADAVRLAVRNNRVIENAYLNRRADRYDRRTAMDKFVPDLALSTDATVDDLFQNEGAAPRIDQRERAIDAGVTLSTLLPTGTRLSVGYDGHGDRTMVDGIGSAALPDSLADPIDYRQSVQVRVEQPLLKDFGWGVNQASLRIARLEDAASRLDLQSALIDVVTQTVLRVRRLIQAREQQVIARTSLRRARRLLRRNRRLVEAGRLARLDLVQGQAQVSQQELRLEESRNQIHTARLDLLEILDLDENVVIDPVDSLIVPEVSLDEDSVLAAAFAQRPDLQRAQHAVTIARENRRLADDQSQWDVRLVGSYTRQLQDDQLQVPFAEDPFSVNGGWSVGLSVDRTLGNPRREARRAQSRLAARTAQNRLREQRQQIEIAVRTQVNTVRQRRRQLTLAREVRRLSAEKLAVEEKKLQKGHSSSFQVVSFQNDLVRARQREVQAKIAYLDALTRLDQITGATLRTWNVQVESLP